MKVYISGKISGLALDDAKKTFNEAAIWLSNQGYQPLNPFSLYDDAIQRTWNEYLIEGLKALLDCEGIYLLSNWEQSKGARIEYNIAKETGLTILYQQQ